MHAFPGLPSTPGEPIISCSSDNLTEKPKRLSPSILCDKTLFDSHESFVWNKYTEPCVLSEGEPIAINCFERETENPK